MWFLLLRVRVRLPVFDLLSPALTSSLMCFTCVWLVPPDLSLPLLELVSFVEKTSWEMVQSHHRWALSSHEDNNIWLYVREAVNNEEHIWMYSIMRSKKKTTGSRPNPHLIIYFHKTSTVSSSKVTTLGLKYVSSQESDPGPRPAWTSELHTHSTLNYNCFIN